MAAVRDHLCDIGRMEIPRPKCQGMQFVATKGKQGFYRTIRANGAQYGINIKPQGPRRPMLSNELFTRMDQRSIRPETVKEEENETPVPSISPGSTSTGYRSSSSLSSSQHSSNSISPQPPVELAPDYPDDYVPPHLRNQNNQNSQQQRPAGQHNYQKRY